MVGIRRREGCCGGGWGVVMVEKTVSIFFTSGSVLVNEPYSKVHLPFEVHFPQHLLCTI